MELSLWHQVEKDNIKILQLKLITIARSSRTLHLRYRSKKGLKTLHATVKASNGKRCELQGLRRKI